MEDSNLLRKDNIRGTYKKEVLDDDELAIAYEQVREKYRKQGIYLPDNKMEIDVEKLSNKLGIFKGISAKDAYGEIERIKTKHSGLLTAQVLLDESRNSDAIFHKCFEWSDDRAAELFRLEQARHLLKNIEVNVLSNGEQRKIRVYEVVKQNPKGEYKSLDTFTPDDIDYVRRQAIKNLISFRNKLSVYEKFSTAVKNIDNAISELEVFEQKEQVAA